ncbi:MAG: mannose-1-phosphate guanylyltransferase [Bacteroidales bacterium]|nr:mannose-1-phosphate guanylyltransferase [Bacteroidales bacterium]MCL2132811.1 mannose-1-phosphate guanylyltransferase [Bacteroidales bacterium]
MNTNFYCVIMAGGIGSRFWPISRNLRPKQFLDILGTGRTFLQETFHRFAKILPKENILIVTGSQYTGLVNEQLPNLNPMQIVAEPSRCNTAPCIAYATYKILDKNPNATIVVAPSDHLIINEAEFLSIINKALEFADTNESLVTLGIKPTRPETGYGYIQLSHSGKDIIMGEAYKVKTFTEKPTLDLAKVFVKSGEFFWNSGLFAWKATTIQTALKNLLPEVNVLFEQGVGKYNKPEESDFIKKVYNECLSVSIDYGVMEKADNVYVFPGDFGWSDLGTWESLYLQWNKDDQSNMVDAQQVILKEVSNSSIAVSKKEKLVVIKELDNYLIVDTDDVLLICPRNNEEQIKQIMRSVDPKYL